LYLSADTPIISGNIREAFVANSNLDTVAPGEELKTFLGVDESIKVEYKFLKKYQKNEGLMGRKTRFIYEYLILLTNHKKTDEKINIQDQIPISKHQDIEVRLLEPNYKQDTDILKKDQWDKLEWDLTLTAGEKKEIPLKFSVESPKDVTVEGLI
jgi:uncharacterized protein (TIGR02231 family)